jgi:hypothetical protein
MKNNKNLINRDYAENDPNSMRSQLRRTGQIRTARELLDEPLITECQAKSLFAQCRLSPRGLMKFLGLTKEKANV